MIDLRFERPVSIFMGLGFPTTIESVETAQQVLDAWEERRGPAWTAASNACHAARDGAIEPDTVRGIFAAFARAHGILVPDAAAIDAASGRAAAKLR